MIVFSHRLLAIEIRLVSLWGAQKNFQMLDVVVLQSRRRLNIFKPDQV